ncbi:MAG: hypothetical protein IKP47_06890 [Ruminococcus sp.]|nr:hypothetical protein [Ruminococcus sp.]
MFGYIRPYKPYLRICEYEAYRSVYCGVCKTMGREYGELTRLTLSFDAAFMALIDMSVNGIELKAEQQRCPAHPFVKRRVAVNSGLENTACASVILLFHKLRDDLADGSLKERAIARPSVTAFTGAYIKARKVKPKLCAAVEKCMRMQAEAEAERTPSIDRACEPTARMIQAVFAEISDDKAMSKKLGSFGYFIGRYVYLVDALDDLRADCAAHRYNPIAVKLGLDGELTDEQFAEAAQSLTFSIRMTLGQLAEQYLKLDLRLYKSIIDNIIYLGLNDVFERVRAGSFNKKNEERKVVI